MEERRFLADSGSDEAGPPEAQALGAWRRLYAGRVEPEAIELLRGRPDGRSKSLVYRLAGLAPDGSAVIAKWCSKATGHLERTIYREILPHLPVTAPHFYGFAGEPGDRCWLFLEDVGSKRYSALEPEQCALAGEWLGRMHPSAARLAAAAQLPDRGPRHYRELLRSVRHSVVQNLANPMLEVDDVAVLEAVWRQCDLVESIWRSVEQVCEGMPPTLAHGDFRPKNAYLRRTRAGSALFPIDWEHAGWGVPAADLTRVDLVAYWSVVRACWPHLDLPSVRRLATAGQIFRWIAAMSWVSLSLAAADRDLVCKAMAEFRVYQARLAGLVQMASALSIEH